MPTLTKTLTTCIQVGSALRADLARSPRRGDPTHPRPQTATRIKVRMSLVRRLSLETKTAETRATVR